MFRASRWPPSSSRGAGACSGSAPAKAWKRSWCAARRRIRGRVVRRHPRQGLEDAAPRALRALAACWQSRGIIRRRAPDVVLGLGGFASFPGALAGVAMMKPLVLHDANAVAGLANRVLAYGADRVLLGFPEAMRGRHAAKVAWVGNPLRDAIRPRSGSRGAILGTYRTAPPARRRRQSRRRGAQPHAFPRRSRCCRRSAPARRASGRREAHRGAAIRLRRAGVSAECISFIVDMAARYAEADVVLCRGGAITVAELAAVGVGRDDRAVAGRDRRRAERERAVSRRCRSRAGDPAARPHAARRSPRASLVARERCSRWRSRRARSRASTPPIVSPTPASRCGSGP